MTKQERIHYLDMTKGIGMLLVVIGHISYVSEPIRQYVSAFHMSLFFFVSGMLIWYKEEEKVAFKTLFRKKLKSLMLPYAFFSILYFIMEPARLLIKNIDNWDEIFRQIWQAVCLQGVSTLWFLPALFMGELIFIWLRKHTGHLQTILCLVIIVITMYYTNREVKDFFCIHGSTGYLLVFDVLSMLIRNLLCVVLVGIGYYVGSLLLTKRFPLWVEGICSIAAFVGVGIIVKYNPDVALRSVIIGNPLLFFAGGIAGALGVLFACRVMARLPLRPIQRVCEYYGRNSLLIMVTHLEFRILYLGILLATAIGVVASHNALFCTFIVVFVFLTEIVVIEAAKRILALFSSKKRNNS